MVSQYPIHFLTQELFRSRKRLIGNTSFAIGNKSPLLASANNKSLPKIIRQRSGKGHFGEIYYRGLAFHLDQIKSLLELSGPLDHAIDKNLLIDCIQKASLGASNDIRVTDRLDLAISLLSWVAKKLMKAD